MEREPRGTDVLSNNLIFYNLILALFRQILLSILHKYGGISLRAGFENCPQPYLLVVNRISLDTSPAKPLFQISYTTIYT